jgi:hypothetical protein
MVLDFSTPFSLQDANPKLQLPTRLETSELARSWSSRFSVFARPRIERDAR